MVLFCLLLMIARDVQVEMQSNRVESFVALINGLQSSENFGRAYALS